MRDLTYAVRTLRKSPGFTVAAVLTIALGIGASTAIFSVASAVLLRPLPYQDPQRLVLASIDSTQRNVKDLFTNADFLDVRVGTRAVFEDMAGVFTFRLIVPREDGSPERIYKAQVTTNFFRMMGAKIALGRDFTRADGQPQPTQPRAGLPAGSVAILSHEYWQRRYGGDAAVIGREMLSFGQRGPQVVGVLAPGFELFFPPSAGIEAKPDVWIANNLGYDHTLATLRVIGRMKEGVSLKRAREQVQWVAAEMENSGNASSGVSIRLEPMQQYLVEEVRPAIVALMGAVIFLLLIACANVANLLLVRALLRQRELAVRAALGGGCWRLARQLLTEALLLAGLGTLLGVGFAWVGVHELLVVAPPNLPRADSIAMDWAVLGFATLAGLMSAALFGVAPAWRAARPDVIQVLRGGGPSAGLRAGRVLRNSVVVAEVALSFVLLIGSGLMVRSFVELQRIDPGYDARRLLTFLLVRDWDYGAPAPQRLSLLGEIQQRLGAVPGVESASASALFPLTGGSFSLPWGPEDALADPAKFQAADSSYVLPGYFETLRTRLTEGRTFNEDDNALGRKVAVIDESLAAKAFPNETAVGKRILVGLYPGPVWMEVIGVVGHQRQTSLAEPGREQIYLTEGFAGFGISRRWALRTAGEPSQYGPAVRAALAELDPQLLILEMQPMEALVERAQAKTRFSLLLIAAFAVIAAVLAAVGLYGVLSTAVRQRRAEIGVRIALGAASAGVYKLVVGQGMLLSAAGVAMGLIAAFGLTRMMESMLVGVEATDPATFAAVVVLFFVIAAIACWLPARRAASIDPAEALRAE